jgi:hypothetical protein
MAANFSDTIVIHRAIQREFARRVSAAASGTMYETVLKTRELIARSYDALAEADRLMADTRRKLNRNRS